MSGDTQNYSDAIGYLDDLVTEINQPWFKLLRDVILINNSASLDADILESICKVLLGEMSEVPSISSSAQPSSTAHAAACTDYLERLSSYSNFKLLSNALQIDFCKQLTLIFGTNGSGKSSLCESLKIMANPDRPKRPIKNLRMSSATASSFDYKFKSDTSSMTWNQAGGYGVHADKIKYFDSAVATNNATVAVEPGRVIALTPFRLGVFESLKTLTSQVREAIKEKQGVNTTQLMASLTEINTDFKEFDESPLKSIAIVTMGVLAGEISKAEAFDKQTELAGLLTSAEALEKASSDTGLKAVKLEHRELDLITSDLQKIADSAESLWGINPVEKTKTRDNKKAEQTALANALIPKEATLEKLLALLKATSDVCELDKATGQVCPLCRRSLEETQIKLFKQYHELITGQLEADISGLNTEIKKAIDLISIIQAIDLNAWDKLTTVSTEDITNAKETVAKIITACSLTAEPTPEASGAVSRIMELISANARLLLAKSQAIEASTKGRDTVIEELKALRSQIKPLSYLDFLSKRLDKLQNAQQMVIKSKKFNDAIAGFTSLLTKITLASKSAYEKLIVGDFEGRLNQEYKNLTEKEMCAFGVTLKRIGSDASVTVKPQVGSNGIDEVLSEGELRMHSLALFFAELECSCGPIIVFDDPISSFDYNYIENYCIRLRNFALTHPSCQIIILTHNWEFFVQLQNKLNAGGLNSKLSVQVLESCCFVAEYSEKADELKRDINAILSQPSEPSKQEKEEMAGKMRRLIEVVVNTHVFNGQRHQYKQKNQSVSVFQEYTKVTPLIQTEAVEHGDLFSKMSVTEHDDPRSAYVNTDKETFQARFDRINSIETAIISRR